MKECRGCNQVKPLAEFSAHSGFKDGRNSKCKACKELIRLAGVESGRYKAKRPYNYLSDLRYKYGLTQEQYKVMLIRADNRCEICSEESKLNVDHCHETGRVRGLLCTRCNTGLGKFGNKGERLQRALDYLDGEPARSQEPPAKRTA